MDNKYWKYIKVEHIFLTITLVFSYLIFIETNKMKTDFQEIERQWDSLDVVIESYQTRVNEIDSINKQMSKELASFEEYK
jgi:hypothetical protein